MGQDADALTGLLHEQAATWLTQYNELLAENKRLQTRLDAANELARRARTYLRGAPIDTVDWRQARERALREAVEAFGFPLYEHNRAPM